MRNSYLKCVVKAAVKTAGLLLCGAVATFGQQQVNLTAGPAGMTMADGNGVPMWGYRCGTLATGVTSSATCAYLAGPTSPAAVGALGAISVINGGSGYATAPMVTITPATGNTPTTAASAVANVANGQVVSIALSNPGAGYTATPTVTIGAPTTGTAATANAGLAWSPVVITVPTGAAGGLQINLTNTLTFTPAGATTANNIPTSITIVGQVGGGLGTVAQRTTLPSPDHSNAQGIYTWVTANLPGTGTPPVQGLRVMSFATEVLPVGAAALTGEAGTPCVLVSGACALTWSSLKPGTYMLESGTHPSIQVPMGLIGMLVVTCPPAAAAGACGTGIANGTAYPAVTGISPAPAYAAVTYSAEVPLEFSEIDPVQNNSVNIAVNTAGFSETAVWSPASTGPITGTNIVSGGSGYSSGTTGTILGANGKGATVNLTVTGGVITGASVTAGGSGYSATSPANVLVSDPAGTGSGAIITAEITANTFGCGAATGLHTCYPPAVNYTPFYYLINGVAFNKTNSGASNFPVAPATGVTAGTGTVLARLVNAGLRMHVPSIVGSQTTGFNGAGASATVGGFTLIAEDGNVVPNLLPNTNLTGQVAAPKVQTDVFMAAGKTYDVMINAPAAGSTALPIYSRDLGLSANSSERDAGMLAYISVNGAGLPSFGAGIAGTPVAVADTYNSVVTCAAAPCTPIVVSDVSKGVIANDSFVYGVQLAVGPTAGTLTCGATGTTASAVAGLCANGTFTYTPNVGATGTSSTVFDTFQYCANGTTLTSTPSYCTTVTLGPSAATTSTLTMNGITYTANAAGYISIPPPGPLSVDKDSLGYPLNVVTTPAPTPGSCTSLTIEPNGGFIATAPTTATSCNFTYTAMNNHGLTGTATVTIDFPTPSNLSVTVVDGAAYKAAGCNAAANVAACVAALPHITDYRWIIEEDKTFYVNPACTTNTTTPPAGCPQPTATTVPPTFAVNFHTSHMEYVAQGCTGSSSTDQSCEEGQTVLGVPSVCEVGNGVCVPGTARTALLPSQVTLDPGCGFPTHPATLPCSTNAPYPKRYYISVLPGDAGNPFTFGYAGNPAACTPVSGGTTTCGHGMGGASVSWNTVTNSWNPVIVLSEPSPYLPGKVSVQVFEDDFPLNGEQDAGGGVDVIASNEPGLGGFEIILWDSRAQFGDTTGQMTHDMFNQPLSNSLAGTIDPATTFDACPISPEITANTTTGDGSLQGLTGRIVTCPKYESDGKTLSPLAGEAVVANVMPMQLTVQAYPGADRIARGEEWLQTNTLDGQHPHDAFVKIGEPAYFQEYGPAGFHVSIGFANPAIINARHAGVCAGTDLNLQATNCTNTVTGKVTMERLSRPPDERLYSSGSRDAYFWTQCWVSLGDPDGEDFEFTKCDANGNFTLTGVPSGDWRITVGDQWNDQIIDGLSTPVGVCITGGNGCGTINMGDVPVQQWQSNLYTRTFIDDNKDGVYQSTEVGIPFLNTTVRYRDGSMANNLLTDFTGTADFNETFPLFNWYVVETDNTRYKTTGIHTVYDVGGPADGSPSCGGTGNPPCGPSGTPYAAFANTYENVPLPSDLSVPGAVYCSDATCSGSSIWTSAPNSQVNSSGRIDPPWVFAEGWQGHIGQGNFIEFGKTPYASGENGGIRGHVVYAATRPFDDPQMLVQTQWTPLIPHVTMNLYQEGFAADGVTPTLTLVDTTQTSSWDDWAQGFRSDGAPNMNCPGQGGATGTNADVFFYSIFNQPNYLNLYNYYYNGGTLTPLSHNSQYKCYDGMHNWNQIQPAPYDGVYQFPSVLGIIPSGTGAGKLNTSLTGGVGTPGTTSFIAATMKGTNCTICIPNPDTTDPWRVGTPMLPPGKYVVEVVPPPGYELVKEEDKNILIGDNFIAPVSQQFGAIANIFILPDQASVASMYDPSGAGLNPNNAQDPTQSVGFSPTTSTFVPGFLEPNWPCVGQARIVPDYMSLFPQAHQVAAFAGATRHLCDRKEVTLPNQMAATAKFWLFTSTHIASKYTGIITDDFTSEFDPFAPTFGEKFSPPNQPVSTRDWNGLEISRVYSDQWGAFNGMTYSTWEVNPPNPTGYAPSMFVQCMNDAGPVVDTRPTIVNSAGQTVPNPTYGQVITDPLFNPLYSDFCYENPYLPGITGYLDTPVVPTAGFVGAGYNNPDCAYPAETPAIAEVDGDGVGPWVSATGHSITVTALGDQVVTNYGYAGPQSTKSPYNQKTVTRHYGFGARCTSPTASSATCNTVSSVTIGGAAAIISSWSDTQIVAVVPGGLPGSPSVPLCPVQQQTQYGGSQAHCGELVITAGNGRQSVDSVTVTAGGKAPTHVAASASIQAAIDAAAPGDLIIVDPTSKAGCVTSTGTVTACSTAGATVSFSASNHRELLIMWKPVRLQGVGAASSIIDASTHPAGNLKLDPWRRSVNCLFGLAMNGQPLSSTNPFDNPLDNNKNPYTCPTPSSPTASGIGPNGNAWNNFYGGPNFSQLVVDRIPLEGILGWDATVNGNLAEQLQEPSIMGAYEGAAITVVAKGVNIPAGSTDVYGSGAEASFPTGSTLLTGPVNLLDGSAVTGDLNPLCHTSSTNTANPFPSNFICNPSSIDGLGITDASQGGGAVFLHAWTHYLQIANNRMYNNAGTLSGGLVVGQGEFPEAILAPNATAAATSSPGSCSDSPITNTQLPYCQQLNVNIHHNMVVNNSATGDELFTGTPAGAGGVSICTGSDYYKFNYNWVCGNFSSGDGGGVGQLGFSYNGDIEHNTIVFNQSTNPSIPANGGGLLVIGAAPDATITVNGVATECGSVTDNDCVPGLSDGTGPGLLINGNLIEGNGAEAGSGGGIRLQGVNGADVARFPANPERWYHVTVQNNIINNNVAGWDGGGVSLEDSLAVTLINNTIASNDTSASSGSLFRTLGAPLASSQSPTPNCLAQNGGNASCPQPAGLVSMANSPQLTTSFTTGAITCPPGNYAPGTSPTNGTCTKISYPALYNNIFWQNRSFQVAVGPLGTGAQNQQNVVSMFNAAFNGGLGSPAASQASTGACPAGASYWDIGVRNDTGPANHGSGYTLNPLQGVLTSTTGYSSTNLNSNPLFGTGSSGFGTPTGGQYCNGSRVPPEAGGLGWQVPAGIADAVVPNPIFSLTPTATVDEGNNWVNISWGPLSMLNPVTSTGTTNAVLGNYSLQTSSTAVGHIPCTGTANPGLGCTETIGQSGVTTILVPKIDFFGHPRPEAGGAPNTVRIDVGAVELQLSPPR